MAAPIGPIIDASLKTILPEELSLELYSSQYLQRHPGNAKFILAAAKGSYRLGGTLQELEDVVFGALNPEVELDLRVRCQLLWSHDVILSGLLSDLIGHP